MKKSVWILVAVVIVALTVGITGYAYAQGGEPPQFSEGFGPGMMGGFHGRGGMMGGNSGYGMMGFDGEYGPMHEGMVAAFAEATGLTVDEIEARHDAGETMWDIATDAGLSEDEVFELMLSAREASLADAVANGWITEEQAEWMTERMSQMWSGDYEFGSGGCGGRGHGRGFNNPAWQTNEN